MTRRRGLSVAVLFGAAVAGAAVVAVLVTGVIGDSDNGLDPRFRSLPRADGATSDATLEYLDGRGAALLVMHETAVALVDDPPDTAKCRELASQLDDRAPARAIVGQSAGVPDAVLQAAFFTERGLLGTALTMCINAGRMPEAVIVRMRTSTDLVSERIGQLEEASQ